MTPLASGHGADARARHSMPLRANGAAHTSLMQSSSLARIFIPVDAPRPPFLINTLLQRGVSRPRSIRNRFNGFHSARETVETVSEALPARDTPLKRGVNGRRKGNFLNLPAEPGDLSFFGQDLPKAGHHLRFSSKKGTKQ